MTGAGTPQEVLFRTAALLADWPLWPTKPVTTAIAHAVGQDADIWTDPEAHDAASCDAAEAALLHLGAHIARLTGSEGVLTWDNMAHVRLTLELWANTVASRDAVLKLITNAANTAPAEA